MGRQTERKYVRCLAMATYSLIGVGRYWKGAVQVFNVEDPRFCLGHLQATRCVRLYLRVSTMSLY